MKKLSFVLITLLVFLSACSSGNSLSIEGEWKLISYGDAASPTPAVPDVEAFINFGSDGQYSGNVGCNGFGGGYTVNGNQVTFEAGVSTLMFCEGTSDQENGVLGILSDQILTSTITGSQLTLTSADGSSVIVLERK
jgi:heat shock protein HslJ